MWGLWVGAGVPVPTCAFLDFITCTEDELQVRFGVARSACSWSTTQASAQGCAQLVERGQGGHLGGQHQEACGDFPSCLRVPCLQPAFPSSSLGVGAPGKPWKGSDLLLSLRWPLKFKSLVLGQCHFAEPPGACGGSLHCSLGDLLPP